MPLIENVIKTAINHFKIDVNKLVNDSDSHLQSKSSIHSSVTVNKNDDFLALDRTPRNGRKHLVRQYRGRHETEDIKKDLHSAGHGILVNNKLERVSRYGPTSEFIRC